MKKYKKGYTTGVFDLFHIGHLNILRRAKEQCDYLIVGVSTDQLVLEYKKRAAIVPFDERIEIVRSIRYVDEVVPQIHRDKLAAFHQLQFDVMFVGDDWKGNALFLDVEKELGKHGVEVVYFTYSKHVSSTLLAKVLEKIEREG